MLVADSLAVAKDRTQNGSESPDESQCGADNFLSITRKSGVVDFLLNCFHVGLLEELGSTFRAPQFLRSFNDEYMDPAF